MQNHKGATRTEFDLIKTVRWHDSGNPKTRIDMRETGISHFPASSGYRPPAATPLPAAASVSEKPEHSSAEEEEGGGFGSARGNGLEVINHSVAISTSLNFHQT